MHQNINNGYLLGIKLKMILQHFPLISYNEHILMLKSETNNKLFC